MLYGNVYEQGGMPAQFIILRLTADESSWEDSEEQGHVSMYHIENCLFQHFESLA